MYSEIIEAQTKGKSVSERIWAEDKIGVTNQSLSHQLILRLVKCNLYFYNCCISNSNYV